MVRIIILSCSDGCGYSDLESYISRNSTESDENLIKKAKNHYKTLHYNDCGYLHRGSTLVIHTEKVEDSEVNYNLDELPSY